MVSLSARDLSFLHNSNSIEDITNIDYSLPENGVPGRGHVGAFLKSQDLAGRQPGPNFRALSELPSPEREQAFAKVMAKRHARISIEHLTEWQRLIAEEQLRFGHSIPREGIGVLRGPDAPFNVWVGNHIAPLHEEVAGLMADWIHDLNARLDGIQAYRAGDSQTADILGEFFQRFEAIHPFVDGNGRVGRLVANYIATACGYPIIVFRPEERPAFYAAHRKKLTMKLFMAEKIREAVWNIEGKLLERVAVGTFADIYETDGVRVTVERHELYKALAQWERELEQTELHEK